MRHANVNANATANLQGTVATQMVSVSILGAPQTATEIIIHSLEDVFRICSRAKRATKRNSPTQSLQEGRMELTLPLEPK